MMINVVVKPNCAGKNLFWKRKNQNNCTDEISSGAINVHLFSWLEHLLNQKNNKGNMPDVEFENIHMIEKL